MHQKCTVTTGRDDSHLWYLPSPETCPACCWKPKTQQSVEQAQSCPLSLPPPRWRELRDVGSHSDSLCLGLPVRWLKGCQEIMRDASAFLPRAVQRLSSVFSAPVGQCGPQRSHTNLRTGWSVATNQRAETSPGIHWV